MQMAKLMAYICVFVVTMAHGVRMVKKRGGAVDEANVTNGACGGTWCCR